MKLLTTLRALLATCLVAASSITLAAPIPVTPTLIINSGILMGAKNVTVGGALYNVTFADGSCNSLFNGCVQSAFAFKNVVDATAAAQSLLDTVFLDGPLGKFDTVGNTTFGCSSFGSCVTFIPYASGLSSTYLYADSVNYYVSTPDRTAFSSTRNENDFSGNLSVNFAIFQLANTTAIPEPGTIALIGLALAGIITMRRRKS